MRRKNIFTEAELERIRKCTEKEKYETVKRELAKQIHRYIKANSALCEKDNVSAIYDKAVGVQVRHLLGGVMGSDYNTDVEIVEDFAKIEVEQSKDTFSAEATMERIMRLFWEM